MKSSLLIIFALCVFVACGRPDKVDLNKQTVSQTDDLNGALAKADSAVAKTERLVRKLRLAEVILSKKLNLVSKEVAPTSVLNACLSDKEMDNSSEWNWLCNSGGATGKSYFTYTGSALQKIENEMSTNVNSFGTAREVMSITDIADSTDMSGQRMISFKLNWELYKNSISEKTLICKSSSSKIKLNVGQRNVKDKDGNVVLDPDGKPVVEYFVDSITIDRVSMHCEQTFNSTSSDNTSVELKPSTLNIFGPTHLLTGSLNFDFSNDKLTYTGAMSLDDTGLTEPSEGKIRTWGCSGQPLCFP